MSVYPKTKNYFYSALLKIFEKQLREKMVKTFINETPKLF